MDNSDSALEWLRMAEMDLDSARFLLGMHPVPAEVICYHCQQCAEKSLKSVLVKVQQEPKKIHDLTVLLQECIIYKPSLLDLSAQAAALADFATLTRYPPTLSV